jgi:uncharacterized caspase-like protein
MAPYPRYVGDYLVKLCSSARQPLRQASGRRAESGSAHLRSAVDQETSANEAADQCKVAANTKERLAQFSKLCSGNRCDHAALFHDTSERMRALVPSNPEMPSQQAPKGNSGSRSRF